MNTSTFEGMNTSTFEGMNTSTFEGMNTSTFEGHDTRDETDIQDEDGLKGTKCSLVVIGIGSVHHAI